MKVGDYIRTDDGLLGKVVSEPYEYKDSIGCDIDFGNNDIYNEYEMYQRIVRSNPDALDLIKIGDIIVYKTDIGSIRVQDVHNSVVMAMIKSGEIEVLAIVTKEQFESMVYKL